jgi:hypothetical protein
MTNCVAQQIKYVGEFELKNLSSNSPIFLKDYSQICHFDSFVLIRKKSDIKNIYKYNLNTFNVDTINLKWNNFDLEFSNLLHKESKVTYTHFEKNLYILSFNKLFIFKESIEKNVYMLEKIITNDKLDDFGEIAHVTEGFLFSISEIQINPKNNEGICLYKINLNTGKIILKNKINSQFSYLFYFKKNAQNYFSVKNEKIYIHGINNNQISIYDKRLKHIKTIQTPFKINTKVVNQKDLYYKFKGNIKLFDTIEFISNNIDRFESIYTDNGKLKSGSIIQIKFADSSKSMIYYTFNFKEFTLINDSIFNKLFVSNYVSYHNGLIYIWNGFGNISYINNQITKEQAMEILLNKKLYPRVYVYKIN